MFLISTYKIRNNLTLFIINETEWKLSRTVLEIKKKVKLKKKRKQRIVQLRPIVALLNRKEYCRIDLKVLMHENK